MSMVLRDIPKLIDEATTGLDPVVREEILDLFLEFIQDASRSIFFSSHITSDVEKIADYVVLLHQGRLLLSAQKDELLDHYGILKCRRSDFAALSPDDYLIARQSAAGVACLVKDRALAKKAHPNLLVDRVTLEEIMLFYAKGEVSCGA